MSEYRRKDKVSRLLPYPWLVIALIVIWLLLAGFTWGQFLIGLLVALIAGWSMTALQPVKPRPKHIGKIIKLFAIVFYDIVRSNIAVAIIILHGGRRIGRAGFLVIPLQLRDPTGLAVLSIIITSTPGTIWVDYDPRRSELLLHILDLIDETAWIHLIQNRYERLLREIFE